MLLKNGALIFIPAPAAQLDNSLVPISTPGWKEAPWEERTLFKYTTRHELWKLNSSLKANVSYDKLANYARNV